jgi:hypothetical protein
MEDKKYSYYEDHKGELHKIDSIVTSIVDKFHQRAVLGKVKYKVTMDRDDLSLLEWINHAQEEHMDAIVYLEKLKQKLKQDGEAKTNRNRKKDKKPSATRSKSSIS